MEIKRINSYTDSRFSQNVLRQHGAFLLDGTPYEVEIISDFEGVLRGENPEAFPELIEEFRFYAPHITLFYDAKGKILMEFPKARVFSLSLEDIQPSQFYVDEDKIAAIRTFIHKPEDIILQVLPHNGRYISLDGHTRLYYAVMQGWASVSGVLADSEDYIYKFAAEANRRGIFSPRDMALVPHGEYREKWDGFCEAFFSQEPSK